MSPEREVKNIYAFYLDIFFVRLFLVNSSILILSFILLKIPLRDKIIRAVLSVMAGCIAMTLLLIFLKNYILFKLLSVFILSPLTIVLAAGQKKACLKLVLTTYLSTAFVGGLTELLDENLGADLGLEIVIGLLMGYLCINRIYMSMWNKRNYYQVKLSHKGQNAVCRALYDTGNMLKTPQGKGVSIADRKLLEKMDIEPVTRVEYSSLGSGGCLDVYELEEMKIYCHGKTLLLQNVMLGICREGLLEGKGYDIILNEAVFNSKKCMEGSVGRKRRG